MRRRFLFRQCALLRAARVDQDRERKRQIGLLLEREDVLRHAVFEYAYVALLERIDEAFVLIDGGEQDVRQIGFDGYHLVIILRNRVVRGRLLPRGWWRRRRALLTLLLLRARVRQ